MITAIDQLYESIRDVVALASGVPEADVVLADQGKPPPQTSQVYGTYKPTPIRAYGQPRKDRTLTTGVAPLPEPGWQDIAEATVTQLDLMVSVNFLNADARDAAWRMHNAGHRQPVRELLYSAGIAWRYCSDIRDLTGLYQADFQPRYQLDLNLYVETAITDTVLRAAGFSLDVQDSSGNVLYDEVTP